MSCPFPLRGLICRLRPRRRERRAFPALLAGMLICLGLAGCVPKENGVQVLRFSIWGTVRQAAIEEQIARAFEAEHPGVRVEVMYFSAGYQEKMQAMIVSKSMPDVLMVDSMVYADWGSRGVLQDVTGVIDGLDRESEFMPVALDVFRLHGRMYALPINAQSLVMYVNTGVLASAGVTLPEQGLTWEEFAALGPQLSRRGGNPQAPIDYLWIPPSPTALMLSFGAKLFDDTQNPTRVTIAGPNAVAAVKFTRQLMARGFSVPLTAQRDEGAYQLFRDGRVAFIFSGRYISTELRGRTKFEWDIVPMPKAPGGIAESVGTGLAISRDTKQTELAREFMRFYANKKAVGIAARGGRIVPVRREFAYGEEFLSQAPPPSIGLFSRVLERGSGGPYLQTAGTREVYDVLFRRMEQAIVEPGIPAEEIVDLMQADLERWLKRAKEKGRL